MWNNFQGVRISNCQDIWNISCSEHVHCCSHVYVCNGELLYFRGFKSSSKSAKFNTPRKLIVLST